MTTDNLDSPGIAPVETTCALTLSATVPDVNAALSWLVQQIDGHKFEAPHVSIAPQCVWPTPEECETGPDGELIWPEKHSAHRHEFVCQVSGVLTTKIQRD